jgi:hypothetical protein
MYTFHFRTKVPSLDLVEVWDVDDLNFCDVGRCFSQLEFFWTLK